MNYIIYGKENSLKYKHAMEIICPHSKSNLNYKRKIEIVLNDHKYYFNISDCHIEVDFELLGTNEYNIWIALYQQIQTICKEIMGKCFVLCFNFHCIKDELLEIFYIFLRDHNIQFVLCTRHISCLPDTLKHKCEIICLKEKKQPVQSIQLCDPIIDTIQETNIDYFLIREQLYNILTYNLNIHECFYYIISTLFKNEVLHSTLLVNEMDTFFNIIKKYNNNYRTIYHLERFVSFLIILKRRNIEMYEQR